MKRDRFRTKKTISFFDHFFLHSHSFVLILNCQLMFVLFFFVMKSELPGEDPYLNGQYATHYVQGMQQIDNNGYIKMLAFLKHFTAYSREVNRGHDTYNITQHMLFDTYLPAYENAMKIGKASGVMCSYNGINGRPACTNDYILNEVMRQKWNLPNAIVMTDCGVVELIRGPPLMAPSPIHAVAWTLGNGTDIEAGDHLFTLYGEQAVNLGLLNESIIDNAVRRVLKGMMLLGRFDHPYQKKVSWSSITSNSIGSAEHSKIRDDAARQTAVLLRNVGNVLPLRKDNKHHTIVIVGPQAATGFGLLPDYWGDQACPSHDDDHDDIEYDCIVTLYEAIQNIHTGFTLLYSGVDEISIDKNQTKSYQEAIEAVKDYADIVILALGISKYTEYETIDRNETILPGLQNQFALDVLNIAKEKDIPAIVILVNGGTLSVDDLMPKRTYQQNIPTCYQSNGGVPPEQLPRQYAIIEAYNPSFGAKGIAEAIFGIGPISWGRMVTTMYPKTFIMTQPPDQYDLSVGNGLTYRYHTGDVLATFGEGMSHEEPTMSKISCNWNINDDEIPLLHETSPLGTLYCRAWNFDTKRQLSSLVMIYVRASEMIHNATPYPIPRRALKAFQRVMVDPTKHVTFEINITVSDIMFVNEQGNREALPGRYFDMIDIWDGWDNFDSFYVNLPIHNQGIRTSETQ